MARDDAWTSPSDLADYAYCPRAHWYHHHPPSGGPRRSSQERSRFGTRYHRRVLRAEERRERHGGAYWIAFLLGIALLLAGLLWTFPR